jgi:hypothetical protein
MGARAYGEILRLLDSDHEKRVFSCTANRPDSGEFSDQLRRPHIEIESDADVWNKIDSMIRGELPGERQ